MQKYIHINPEDNVIVAVDKLMKGEQVLLDGFSLEIEEDIPAGHKVALQDFQPGTRIVKYGYPIGHAREFIRKGSWVNEKISGRIWKACRNIHILLKPCQNHYHLKVSLFWDIAERTEMLV